MTRTFPDGFLFGSATAAYQIEGAAREDGRAPSIWDTFSHTPGMTANGDTGDVACDHYHRVAEDVALMSDLGLPAYRFSIAWPRVQPAGTGAFNEAGLAFYDDLLDRLNAAGIAPYVTLYHWDLPQALDDVGGWLNRDTATAFADYAAEMARRFGDKVAGWITLNEPWCSAFLGYAFGLHAPGHTDYAESLVAVHHLNLAHGLAVSALRAELAPEVPIGITLNPSVFRPENPDSAVDRAAVATIDAVSNRIFFGPLLDGGYPAETAEALGELTDWSFIRDGDAALIHQPIDFLGINYYTISMVAGNGEPGFAGVELVDAEGERTDMDWVVDPTGLTELLVRIHREHPGLPVYITENGAAYPDEVVEGPGGARQVHDDKRIAYLEAHLDAVGRAIDAGADVRGYFVWSLLDNFEWAYGYTKRFGIVHVDYDTQVRTPKDSAHWFADLIKAHALPLR